MIIDKLECKHEEAYYFHENAPMYCPSCKEVVKYEIQDGKFILMNKQQFNNKHKISK